MNKVDRNLYFNMETFAAYPINPVALPAREKALAQIQAGSSDLYCRQESPLPPEWILEGNPVARSLPLTRASDGNLSSGLWDCQAGKFTFIFGYDEIVHILEGEVTVEEKGRTRTLQAGDVAFFPEGLETRWTVPRYVKKLAVFRSVRHSIMARVQRKLKRLMVGLLG